MNYNLLTTPLYRLPIPRSHVARIHWGAYE